MAKLKHIFALLSVVLLVPIHSKASLELNCDDFLLSANSPEFGPELKPLKEVLPSGELESLLQGNSSLTHPVRIANLVEVVLFLQEIGLPSSQIAQLIQGQPFTLSSVDLSHITPVLKTLSYNLDPIELADWIMATGASGLKGFNSETNEILSTLQILLGTDEFVSWVKVHSRDLEGMRLSSLQELVRVLSRSLPMAEVSRLIQENSALIKYTPNLKRVIAVFHEFGWQAELPEYLSSHFSDLTRLKPAILRKFLNELQQNFPSEVHPYLISQNISVLSRAWAQVATSALLEDLRPLALGDVEVTDLGELTQAVYSGNVEAVQRLLQAEENVNERDAEGNTPLIWLARRSFDLEEAAAKEILAALISGGADLEAASHRGTTALMWLKLWAERPSRAALRDQLQSAGAKR